MSAELATEVAPMLSTVEARRLTAEIRRHLGSAIAGLQAARTGGADAALGYASWHEYVEAEFGDLRELRLPVVERQALVASMDASGMTIRPIAGKLGVSVGTVHGDLRTIRPPADEPAEVIPLPLPPAPALAPASPRPKTDQVVEMVRARGERGMTCLEIEEATGWRHGIASGPLSTVARQGRVRHTGRFREGYGVYVV